MPRQSPTYGGCCRRRPAERPDGAVARAQVRECLAALALPSLPEPPMVASLATEEEKARS